MLKIGIIGYGNLGRGVEAAIHNSEDAELAAVVTRRNPADVHILTPDVPVLKMDDILELKGKADAFIICGGSATDLPEMTPRLAKDFCVIDSFDTHALIPQHYENVNAAALTGGNTAIISVGWDPGMFSVNRLYDNSILTKGKDYTFWGKGVSQGHSDAIRRIEGVKDAKQYTIPIEDAIKRVRSNELPDLSVGEKHERECFVVAEEGADLERITKEIITMPNYFSDYHTTVHFITEEEMKNNHAGIPHGGVVIRSGKTGWNEENSHTIEYSLKLDSNPEFTACVLLAYARAVVRMNKAGDYGCKTVFDVPPAFLSSLSGEQLRKQML